MKTVHEVSELTGVSVRTLHHYDSIGLLHPASVTEAGYRLYDDNSLQVLQTILLFRELQFPLKDIKAIIENPDFDRKKALEQQITLLELQRKRLTDVISSARKILTTGVNSMDFSAFDKSEIDEFSAEAKKHWGETKAYKEFTENTSGDSQETLDDKTAGLMNLFKLLLEADKSLPDSSEAQDFVKKLQCYITDNFYNCTEEILSSLGQMYIGDERMKKNIDNAGGEGTALFVSKAIEVYCERAK